ncbi:MAG TPA: 50S ribosomal protein L5, partial [Candidatus Pacearchaeota archaeon]|nr:50S ribosomal protein L5 [Candidatus Pacearchaeota archaeon]
PVGCKVTLRGKKAEEILRVILEGVKELSEKQFNPGFLTFGIKEYIQIPSVPYKRELGILGFDVAVTLKRKGFRVKKRKIKRSKIGSSHRISKEETIKFFKDKFNVSVR